MTKSEILQEIKTLSSGTVLSVCRTSGLIKVVESSTYKEVDRIRLDWLKFEKNSNTIKGNWIQSWNEYIVYLRNKKITN